MADILALDVSDLIAVGALAVGILFFLFKFVFQSRPANAPPVYSTGLPLIGTLTAFAKNPVTFITAGRRALGDVFSVRIAHRTLTFLTHPRAHDVFFKATDNELSSKEVYRFIVPVFGKGIVYDAPVEIMNEQLRFLTSGLTPSRYRVFVKCFESETRNYIAKWGEQGQIDLLTALSEITILTASRTLLGDEIRESLKENRFAELYAMLEEALTPLSFFFPNLPTPTATKRDAARKEIVALFAKVIESRRANPNVLHEDLLATLMSAKYKDGRALTDDEITGILIAALFAGQHTSSITATWTALNLVYSKNAKRSMEKVMAEQERVMGGQGELTLELVKEMTYLEECMKESLRLFPPLIMLAREVLVPRTYEGMVIPKGDILAVCPPAAHRCEDVFEDPDVFEPERYDAPREEDKKFTFAFIGFGGGRHRCLGMNLAYLQVRAILSVLLREYTLEPVLDKMPELNTKAMVWGPEHPCTVRYRKRN